MIYLLLLKIHQSGSRKKVDADQNQDLNIFTCNHEYVHI